MRVTRAKKPGARPWRSLMLVSIPLWLAACATGYSDNTDWGRVVSTQPDALPPAAATGPQDRAAQGPFQPNAALRICQPRLSNPPAVDRVGFVRDYGPLVIANDRVILAVAPANDVCLSSGFGPRAGRPHKGIDLVASPAGNIYSAAPGIVREARWGRGFGWYVVIDHGGGVYTRYAHLEGFREDVRPGTRLGFGQPLGKMGRTGNATATHLHYEVLTGRWGRKGSFGLTAIDPLSLPVYDPVLTASAQPASAGAGGAP
ncbi:MAG: M23 family metallopeptidase [Pseudomonadota bacterium]